MIKKLIIICAIILIAATVYWLLTKPHLSYPLPETAASVDLTKYAGTWYEIALIPNNFEKGCSCTTATYTVMNDYIKVENNCYKAAKRSYTVIKGKAWTVDNSNSKLKVQFFWPFRGNYWILYIDKNYKYALVGVPSRKYLWILARDTKIPEEGIAVFSDNKLSDTLPPQLLDKYEIRLVDYYNMSFKKPKNGKPKKWFKYVSIVKNELE